MTTLESISSGGPVRDARSGRAKVAIVTGASSGIGLEMVKRLIENDYRVVANSRNITSAVTAAELTKRLAAEALETLRML